MLLKFLGPVCKVLPAMLVVLSGAAVGQPREPSQEELFALLKQWMPGPRDSQVTAYTDTPEIRSSHGVLLRSCDLFPYLELVGVTPVAKEVGFDSVQYDVRLAFRWKLGLQEIKKRERCITGQFELLGMPVKGKIGGYPYYQAPIRFVLHRVGSRWRLN